MKSYIPDNVIAYGSALGITRVGSKKMSKANKFKRWKARKAYLDDFNERLDLAIATANGTEQEREEK